MAANAEQAGSIQYEVELDTEKLLKGSAQAKETLEGLGAHATSASKNVDNLGSSARQAGGDLDSISGKAGKASREFERMGEAANRSAGSMRGVRGVAGQLGWQVQDIAIQAQMGTSAMVILGQQGSQILSVFGPMGAMAGAVLAVGAALGTSLAPGLFDSSKAAKELQNIQKELNEVLKEGKDGTLALTEETLKLAKSNETAAKAKLAATIVEANSAIEKATMLVHEQMQSFDSYFSALNGKDLNQAIKHLDDYETKWEEVKQSATASEEDIQAAGRNFLVVSSTAKAVAAEFGITKTEAIGLLKSFRDFEQDKSPEHLTALATTLSVLQERYGYTNEKLNSFTGKVWENATAAQKAAEMVDYLRNAIANLGGATQQSQSSLDGNADAINRLIERTKQHAQEIGKSARERDKLRASSLGATEAQLKEIDASYDTIEAKEKEIEANRKLKQQQESNAKKAHNKEEQEKQKVIHELEQLSQQYEILSTKQEKSGLEAAKLAAVNKLGSAATKEQQEEAKKLASDIYALTAAQQNFNNIQRQISPVTRVEDDYALKLQQLDEYATLYPQKIEEVEAARFAIEESYRQARIEAQWDEWKQSSDAANMFGSAVEALGANATSVISGLLNGTMTVRDALRSVANTILTSVINSLVQLGMEQVKQAILGRSMAAAQTAASIAQATAIGTAWSTPAAMVSLASYGANEAPAQAAIASTNAMALGLAATPRKRGGPVSPDQLYRVGENNQPEIFQTRAGMQYMIPGNSGRVLSNQDATKGGSAAGGVNVVINQTNYFQSQEEQQDNQKWLKDLTNQIREMVKYELQHSTRDGEALSGFVQP